MKDMTQIENVQRRATKMIPEMKNLTYWQRLRKLNLPTVEYRRQRGDRYKCLRCRVTNMIKRQYQKYN